MAKQQVKCKQCKQSIDKSQAFSPRPKAYFCNEDCSNQWDEEHKPKEASVEEIERKELIAYIGELYDRPNYMLISTQIKQLKNEHNMRYKGIELTLRYFYDILGNEFEELYGWKYVAERYYDECRDFHKSILDSRKAIQSLEDEEVTICKPNDSQRKIEQFKAKTRGVLD